MKINRMKPEDRKEQILSVAVSIAERDGFVTLSRNALAEEAEVANGMIQYVFNDMASLREAVLQRAIEKEIKSIVAQGLALGYESAKSAPEKLKRESIESLI